MTAQVTTPATTEAAAAQPVGPATRDLGFRRTSSTPLLDLAAVGWCAAEARPRPTIMFPTVVDMERAYGRLRHASGAPAHARRAPIDPAYRFHMYYAPHRSAGIGLATAPHPEGPWTPYAGNPIIRLGDGSGLTDHVSSPEVVLRPDYPDAPFWLYFHGRTGPRAGGFGQHTCVATSPDAVAWQVLSPQPVLTATAEQSGSANSAAYARCFARGGWHYALYKSELTHGLARSRDGLTWEHWPHNPLLAPDPAAGDHEMIRHTGLLLRASTLIILYSTPPGPHGGGEEIKAAALDVSADDWQHWRPVRRLGTVLSPALSWEANDVRDPFLLAHEDTLYLYYVGGHEQGVGLARGPLHALDALQ
jgi:hypothetical protein